jgi:hypothetical protein
MRKAPRRAFSSRQLLWLFFFRRLTHFGFDRVIDSLYLPVLLAFSICSIADKNRGTEQAPLFISPKVNCLHRSRAAEQLRLRVLLLLLQTSELEKLLSRSNEELSANRNMGRKEFGSLPRTSVKLQTMLSPQ